jgi:hypothetical protein
MYTVIIIIIIIIIYVLWPLKSQAPQHAYMVHNLLYGYAHPTLRPLMFFY